ncbi:MAG: hypothetical protein JW772_04350 [Candidatus Diapherotrites archaeon]|nr:hypothetical protein [Candidatus Diapherotrites archaeon]
MQLLIPKARPKPQIRRAVYFGAQKERHCMNCGKLIIEDRDFYSRRFCTVSCKEEYCSPIKRTVRTI